MNVHSIILFDTLMDQSMERFSKLSFVKTAVYTHNIEYLAKKVAYITELYADCFTNFGWLPKDTLFYKRILQGNIDSFLDQNQVDASVSQILEYLPEKETMEEHFALPFHIHFTVFPNFCFVSGIIWKDDLKRVFICLSECSIPKDMITIPPGRFAYLSDLLEQYDSLKNPRLKDWISEKELSIQKIQKDSKKYWGDNFYKYYLKLKIIKAVGEVLFTSKTLEGIAVCHNFVKYSNMYRAFKRHRIELSKISRLAKI